MEITILNASEDEAAFHEIVAGEMGTALRKAGKDYIGQRDLSENQLLAMQRFRRIEPARSGYDHPCLGSRKRTSGFWSCIAPQSAGR